MKRKLASCWMLVLLGALFSAPASAAESSDSPPAARQIDQWIQQLDDETFSVREAASKNLRTSGKVAIAALAKAAEADSAEVTERTIGILEGFAACDDDATARAANGALADLAASKHPSAARARRAQRAYQQHIVAALEHCGAAVEIDEDLIVGVSFDSATTLGPNLRLLQELPDLTDLSFSTALMDDEGLAALKGLPRLRNLNLFQSRVSDAGLKYLKTLPSLRRVPMGGTRVTDKGLVYLKDLTQLEYVGLRGNEVTDAGLVHLKNLKNLTGLNLGETKVTDGGLEQLTGLTSLQEIYLTDTPVTREGIARLKRALPHAQVIVRQP